MDQDTSRAPSDQAGATPACLILVPSGSMSESLDDFRLPYAAMDDAELLHLARAYDSLTPPAQEALRSEFAKRNIERPIIEDDGPRLALRDLVTLTRYRDLSEAIVARCMLESAGVPAWLRDENLGRLDWQLSNFIGGLRLQVEAADAEQALALLTSRSPDAITLEDETEFEQPHWTVWLLELGSPSRAHIEAPLWPPCTSFPCLHHWANGLGFATPVGHAGNNRKTMPSRNLRRPSYP